MSKELLIRNLVSVPPDNTIFPASSFITGAALASYFGVTDGTLINNETKWYGTTVGGKYLVVPFLPIRGAIGWTSLYNKGLVYGTDNNGLYPTSTPTNQYKTIRIDSRLYKVRLLRGANTDSTPQLRGYSLAGTSNSEFNKIFMPLSAEDTPLYTGPKLGNYSKADFGFNSGASSWTICIESESPLLTLATARGYDSVNHVDGGTKTSNHVNFGWRPCLELVN